MSLLLVQGGGPPPSSPIAAFDTEDEEVVRFMRKNVAGQFIAGQMNDRTTGGPLTTAVSVLVTGDNGTQTAGAGTLTHKGNGHWNYAPTQAETNFNHVAFTFTHASGVHKTYNVFTVGFNPYDTAGLGLSNLDATIGSRHPSGAAVASVTGAVNSVTNPVTVGTINANVINAASIAAAALNGKGDWNIGKTGYSLANGSIAAATFAANAIDASAFAQSAADKVWSSTTRQLTATQAFNNTGTWTGNVTGSVGSVSGAVTVGTINANVITAGTIQDNAFTATKFAAASLNGKGDWNIGKTGYSLTQAFPTNFAALSITAGGLVDITQGAADKVWLSATRTLTAFAFSVTVGTNSDKTGYTLTGAEQDTIVDKVWDEALSGHLSAGSTGAALNGAGAAGDPWTTTLPGAYGAGTAGNILGNRLDVAVGTRLAGASYTAPDNAGIASISGRLPTALISGRIDAHVGAMATDVLDANALAADAVSEIGGAIPPAVAGSSALNVRVSGFVLTTGIETGTFNNTQLADGSLHSFDDVADVIDLYYEFDVGIDGIPVGVSARANLQGLNDTLLVYGWNWSLSAWEQVGTLPGSGASTLADYMWPLFRAHVGEGADLGKVRVRFAILTGGSNPHLDIDLLYASYSVAPITPVMYAGAVVSATADTLVLPASAPSGDTLRPAMVVVISPSGVAQSRRAEAYDGATRTFTLATPWEVIPDNTYKVRVFAWASVRVSEIDPDVPVKYKHYISADTGEILVGAGA